MEPKMIQLKSLIVGLGTVALFSGCATTMSYFPPEAPNKGEQVTASLSHFSILFLNSFKDTDRLITKLTEQCPDGRIEGITVTRVNRYWPYAGVNYSLKAAGTCVK
jgi:hypothetical protein